MTRPVRIAVIAGLTAASCCVPASAGEQVFWKGSDDRPPRVEPKQFNVYVGGESYLARELYDWRGWGSTKATAKGVVLVDNCRSCAEGVVDWKRRKAEVRLSKKRVCYPNTQNRMQYRHFVFDFRSPKRDNISSNVTCRGWSCGERCVDARHSPSPSAFATEPE